MLPIIFFLALFFPQPATAASFPIIISEIGAFAPSGQEWVEIYNRSADTVDLTGWKFFENKTNHDLKLWCGSPDCADRPLLPPKAFALIAQDANKFMAAAPKQSVLILDSAWGSLNEKGEEIGLKNKSGEWQEHFTYQASPDNSLERLRLNHDDYSLDNWRPNPAGHSAGKENYWACDTVCAAPLPAIMDDSSGTASLSPADPAAVAAPTEKFIPTATTVRLNEIVSGGGSADGFIELYNHGGEAINLSGWQIIADKTKFTLAGTLDPNQYWALGQALTGLVFSGGATTTVSLLTAESLLADRIEAPKTTRDNSFARDQKDVWRVTAAITRGEKNYIIAPNSAPVVWEVSRPETAAPETPVFFSAVGSADPRGGQLGFHWQFGDGEEAYGETVTHNFKNAGNFSITISATSSAGTHDVTRRAIIINTLAPVLTNVALNEILPNPAGPDSAEFIEIFNRGRHAAALDNFQLTAGDNSYTLPIGTQIPGQGYLVFYRRVTKLTLANGQGNVRLLSPRGNIIDSVSYQNAPSEESFSRAGDDGWRWTRPPTPGALNKQNILLSSAGSILNSARAATVRKTPVPIDSNNLKLAAARQLPLRRTVTVYGTVAALPGEIGSQYIYIVDASGGLPIFSAKKTFPALSRGDRVRVEGALSANRGQPRLIIKTADSITPLEGGALPPTASSTVAAALALPLGTLVTLTGQATQINNSRIYLDDGSAEIVVALKKSAQRLRGRFIVGEQLKVTGILEKNGDALELWPRYEQEIIRVDVNAPAIEPAPKTKAMAYPLITFGGGAALLIFNFLKQKNFF